MLIPHEPSSFVSTQFIPIRWHQKSLPASIIATSCRQSFSSPSLLRVWATRICHACFSEQRTVVLPLSIISLVLLSSCASVLVCPFGATTKVRPHTRVPSNHLVVNLGRGKWQVPIALAPQFLTSMSLLTTIKLFCQAYVSGEYPKCKENL